MEGDTTTGVYSKLLHSSTPWQEKIALAEWAWESEEYFLPNKSQVLLDWVSHELISGSPNSNTQSKKHRKHEFSEETFAQCWEYLLVIVQSSNILKAKIPLMLKPQLIQVFSASLSQGDQLKESTTKSVLQCLRCVLENSEMSSQITAKFEAFVHLLASLLSSCSMDKQDGECSEISLECLLVCLDKYIVVQRQQATQKKVFQSMCENLLGPLLSIRNTCIIKSSDDGTNKCSSSDQVVNKIEEIIAAALFHRDHMNDYKSALDQVLSERENVEPASKKLKISSPCKPLFATLWAMIHKSVLESTDKCTDPPVILRSLPFFYRRFLEANRPQRHVAWMVEFQFGCEMCVMIQTTMEQVSETKQYSTSRPGVIHAVLELMLVHDVYQIAEDNSNGKICFNWFSSLRDWLLSQSVSCKVLECFTTFVKLNHYIVEPKLKDVLELAWCGTKQADESNNVLLTELLQTYVKLRQFDVLLKELLLAIKGNVDENLGTVDLPVKFMERFLQLVHKLPTKQTIDIWQLFLEQIRSLYLSSLDGISLSEPSSSTPMLSRLEETMTLFTMFLLNSSFGGIIEHHHSNPAHVALRDLLVMTWEQLLQPFMEVCMHLPHKHKITKMLFSSTLLLWYSLEKLTILLATHKDFKIDSSIQRHLMNPESLSTWPTWETFTTLSSDLKIRYLLELVAVHELRTHCKLQCENCQWKQLLDFVFNLPASIDEQDQGASWDGQVWSVDSKTYLIAHWELILVHAPLLLPLCSTDQVVLFTQIIVKSVSSVSGAVNKQDFRGALSIESLSKRALSQHGLHDIKCLHSVLIRVLWSKIADELLASKRSKKAGDLLEKISNYTTDHETNNKDSETSGEEDTPSSVKEDAESAQDRNNKVFCGLIDELKAVLLEPNWQCENKRRKDHKVGSDDVEKVIHLIKVLKYLPIDWLPSIDVAKCIMGLLVCDAFFLHNCKSLHHLELSCQCRQLLTSIIRDAVSLQRRTLIDSFDLGIVMIWVKSSTMHWWEHNKDSSIQQFLPDSMNLCKALINYLFKYPLNTRGSLDMFCEQLTAELKALKHKLKETVDEQKLMSLVSHLPIIHLTATLLITMREAIEEKTVKPRTLNTCMKYSDSLVPAFLNVMRIILKDGDKVLRSMPVLLESYSAIIQIIVAAQNISKLQEFKEVVKSWKWRKMFDKIVSTVHSLTTDMQTSCDHGEVVIKYLQEDTMAVLKACLHMMRTVFLSSSALGVSSPEEFHKNSLDQILQLLTVAQAQSDESNDEQAARAFTESEKKLLSSELPSLVVTILENCDSAQLKSLLDGLVEQLIQGSDCGSLPQGTVALLEVWKLVPSCKFDLQNKKVLQSILPEFIFAVSSLLATVMQDDSCVVIHILEATEKFLALGKSALFAQYISAVLHVSLAASSVSFTTRFVEFFCKHFSFLSTLLYQHSESIYKTIHTFIPCTSNLLKSLLQRCQLVSSDTQCADQLLVCAQKMSRLYQELSSHKASLSKYSPYIIADYVHQVEALQLPTKIRETLIPGVYCLLDMCGEHELALLHAVLDKGARVLFKTIYEDYNKYHNYKRKIISSS